MRRFFLLISNSKIFDNDNDLIINIIRDLS